MRGLAAFTMIALTLAMAIAAHAAPEEMDIGAMLVGKQMMEVSEVRQMTLKADGKVTDVSLSPDGKYIVYSVAGESTAQCRLAKISTGKTVTIMDAADASSIINKPENWPPDGVTFPTGGSAVWSPDSSLFALNATHFTRVEDKQSQQECAVIYSASGVCRASLPVAEESGIVGKLLFSRDSRKLAMSLTSIDAANSAPDGQRLKQVIQLVDIGTGASQVLCTKTQTTEVVGWSEDGSLLYVVRQAAGGGWLRQLHKISLDGKSDEVIGPESGLDFQCSPDGSLLAVSVGVLTVKNQATGKQVEIAKNVDFLAWAPNSRMLFYEKKESVTDTSAVVRKRDFRSLWLASVQPDKMDRMCIALDAEGAPSCSRDLRRIAYVSQGQLYIAELSPRVPTAEEKLAAGIELTEDETRKVMAQNAKKIAQGVLMYCDDYDGQMPPGDTVTQALQAYVKDSSVFLRPGSKESAFKYLGSGKLSDIESEPDTPIGELDGGYSWKVVMYADGHVQIKPKQ